MAGTSHVIGPCLIQVKYNYKGELDGLAVYDLIEFRKTMPAEAKDLALKILADRDYPDDVEISVLCVELRNEGGTERRPCAIYRRMAPCQARAFLVKDTERDCCEGR